MCHVGGSGLVPVSFTTGAAAAAHLARGGLVAGVGLHPAVVPVGIQHSLCSGKIICTMWYQGCLGPPMQMYLDQYCIYI